MLHFQGLLTHISHSCWYGSPPSRFSSQSLYKKYAPLPKPSLTCFSESHDKNLSPVHIHLTEPLHREKCSPSTDPLHIVWSPQKSLPSRFPLRSPKEREVPFPELSSTCLSKSPWKSTPPPPCPPSWPLWREMAITRAFYTYLSDFPVKQPPIQLAHWRPSGERCLSPGPSIHIFQIFQ
jgi:hypothetical protein